MYPPLQAWLFASNTRAVSRSGHWLPVDIHGAMAAAKPTPSKTMSAEPRSSLSSLPLVFVAGVLGLCVFMRLQLAVVPVYEMPSACIIMPTNGRPEFVEHALGMIKRQEFSGTITEVVVVDDSPAALRVPFLSAGRQQHDGLVVDYVLPAEGAARQSVGAKRNTAVAHCTGEAVVHWDDDDFYASTRLREQLEPLATGAADATVLQHTHTYFVERDELFAARTRTASGCAPPGCGMTARPDHGPHFGTLAYRRSLHSSSAAAPAKTNAGGGVAFPDTSEAEDYAFAQRAVQSLGATLLVVATHAEAREPLFVCVRHGSNTWSWDASAAGAPPGPQPLLPWTKNGSTPARHNEFSRPARCCSPLPTPPPPPPHRKRSHQIRRRGSCGAYRVGGAAWGRPQLCRQDAPRRRRPHQAGGAPRRVPRRQQAPGRGR